MEVIKDTAKVWVFGADRTLSEKESASIQEAAELFCREWTAHKVALHATAEVIKNTFLVIAVDEEAHGASGCSIDAMHKFVRGLEQQYSVSFFDRLRVVYQQEGVTSNVSLRDFEELFKKGEVNSGTKIYNSLVSNGGELAGNFLIPVSDSWLSSRLRI